MKTIVWVSFSIGYKSTLSCPVKSHTSIRIFVKEHQFQADHLKHSMQQYFAADNNAIEEKWIVDLLVFANHNDCEGWNYSSSSVTIQSWYKSYTCANKEYNNKPFSIRWCHYMGSVMVSVSARIVNNATLRSNESRKFWIRVKSTFPNESVVKTTDMVNLLITINLKVQWVSKPIGGAVGKMKGTMKKEDRVADSPAIHKVATVRSAHPMFGLGHFGRLFAFMPTSHWLVHRLKNKEFKTMALCFYLSVSTPSTATINSSTSRRNGIGVSRDEAQDYIESDASRVWLHSR